MKPLQEFANRIRQRCQTQKSAPRLGSNPSFFTVDSVTPAISLSRCLKTRRNYHRMGMIPGSSTVEHSAVNRRVASSNLARGAKSFNQLASRGLWQKAKAELFRQSMRFFRPEAWKFTKKRRI